MTLKNLRLFLSVDLPFWSNLDTIWFRCADYRIGELCKWAKQTGLFLLGSNNTVSNWIIQKVELFFGGYLKSYTSYDDPQPIPVLKCEIW